MKMKVTLHAQASQSEKSGFRYAVFNHEDMGSCGYTALQTIEVEFTDTDRSTLVSGAVAAFREEQKRIRAEAQSKVARLDEAIQSLLCIEHKA